MNLKTYQGIVDVDQLGQTLADDGVLRCVDAVDQDTLALLCSEFDDIHSQNSHEGIEEMELNEGKGAKVRLYELGNEFPATLKFFSSTWMQELSDAYWDARAWLNDTIYVMHEVVGTVHLAQDLHFDVTKTLKFFLYLNDVTTANGAFSCVPGSHRHTELVRSKLGDQISYDNRHLTREHPFSDEQIVPVEGEAGTLIIFTTEVWHRAGIVSEGERKVMRGHTRTSPQVTRVDSRTRLLSRLRRLVRRG